MPFLECRFVRNPLTLALAPCALTSFTISTVVDYRLSETLLCPRHDTPGADLVVGVTSEKGLAVSGPGERDTLWLSALLANLDVLWLELVNLALLLEVEDDDAAGGGGAEPVSVWREDKGVDLVTGGQGVEVLGLVQVPEHGGTVLSTRCAEGTVWGDGDGVDVAGVAGVVGLNAAGSELPNLKVLSVTDHRTFHCFRSEEGKGNSIRAYGDCLSHRPKALK